MVVEECPTGLRVFARRFAGHRRDCGWERRGLATLLHQPTAEAPARSVFQRRERYFGEVPNTKEFLLMATTGATGGDVATRPTGIARTARRLTTETKQAFKTTEFSAMLGLIAAILISAAVINGGDNGTDEFIARQAWLYVSILGAGYFISRGLAKSGSREPYTDDPTDSPDGR
jgi:hypothetical protein